LSGHINIVQFIAAASIGKEESGHGQAEFLILTELCTGLYDMFFILVWTGRYMTGSMHAFKWTLNCAT